MAAGGQAPGHTSCELDENSRLQEKHSGQEDNGFEYTGIDSEFETQNTELVNVWSGRMSNFRASLSCSQNDHTHNWEDCIDSQVRSLPKDLYVETFIRITKNNEECILAYTGILLVRERLFEGVLKRG